MGIWIIVPDQIIDAVKEKAAKSLGYLPSAESIKDLMESYIDDELIQIDEKLHSKYSNTFKSLSLTTFKRALNEKVKENLENSDDGNGVFKNLKIGTPPLLELLCYYSCGKSWEQIFPNKDEIISESFIGDHAEYEIKTNKQSLYINEVGEIGNIRADAFNPKSLYFTMGSYFFYSEDNGENWKRENVEHQIEYLYTNKGDLKNEVYIFTEDAIFIFDKTSKKISKKDLPKAMAPATSFTAGTIKNSNKIIFYAIHHLKPKENAYTFTNSEIWTSEDMGLSWKPIEDVEITNKNSGFKSCFDIGECFRTSDKKISIFV